MRLALNKGRILAAVFAISILYSCEKPAPIVVTSEDFHTSVDKLTEVMIHDIFSPPVASRVYVYPNIAAYEIISQGGNFRSLSNQVCTAMYSGTPEWMEWLAAALGVIVLVYGVSNFRHRGDGFVGVGSIIFALVIFAWLYFER